MPETQTFSKVKLLVVLIFILAVSFVVLQLFFPKFWANLPFFEETNDPARKVVNVEELPKNFPKDLPLITASVVVHNFETTNDSGVVESVRKWESTENLESVRVAYTEYFAKNGWEVITQVTQSDLELISARYGEQFMNVSVRKAINATGSFIEVSVK